MAFWILQWDQNTYMPPGGAESRAAQMAVLRRLRHQLLTSDETARLLEAKETVERDFLFPRTWPLVAPDLGTLDEAARGALAVAGVPAPPPCEAPS